MELHQTAMTRRLKPAAFEATLRFLPTSPLTVCLVCTPHVYLLMSPSNGIYASRRCGVW